MGYIGKIKVSAYHPQTHSLIVSGEEIWNHKKALDGFYSKKLVPWIREMACLAAKNTDGSIGIKRPLIRISWTPNKNSLDL